MGHQGRCFGTETILWTSSELALCKCTLNSIGPPYKVVVVKVTIPFPVCLDQSGSLAVNSGYSMGV